MRQDVKGTPLTKLLTPFPSIPHQGIPLGTITFVCIGPSCSAGGKHTNNILC